MDLVILSRSEAFNSPVLRVIDALMHSGARHPCVPVADAWVTLKNDCSSSSRLPNPKSDITNLSFFEGFMKSAIKMFFGLMSNTE